MNILSKFMKMNFRSILLNFYLFPIRQAFQLPVLFSKKTVVRGLYRGCIKIKSKNIRPGMIQIGFNNVGIIDYKYERSILEIIDKGKIVFEDSCFLGSGIRICVKGSLYLGDSVCFNGNSSICCWKDIKIYSNNLFSWNCIIMDTDFHKIYYEDKIINEDKCIIIKSNNWICNGTQILKGAFIPENCVIGAGSLINKKYETNNCIYAGRPAVKIKENIIWER